MDEPNFLEPEETDERILQMRSEPRDSMFLMATIRRSDGRDVAVKVRNLSSGGLMAECPVLLLREEAIGIELRGIGMISGRVAWIAGGRIGVSFDTTIDPKLARKPVVGGPQPQLVKASRTAWRPGLR